MAALRLAYLCNQYPAPSHTFIRREIEALEDRGHTVLRFSHRRWADALPDRADHEEQAATRYLLSGGAAPLIGSTILAIAASPRRFGRAASIATLAAIRSGRPLAHLAYLGQAARLVRWLRRAGVDHLHAHFGSNPAMVALLSRALGGPPFSFTVHGPEDFADPASIFLPEKIGAAAFVVAITENCAQRLGALSEPSHDARIHVVRCGIGPEYIDAPAPPLPPERRLVCIARFEWRKGQDVLLRALQILAQQDARPCVELIGDGETRPEVEKLGALLGLKEQLCFRGWQDAAAVLKAIDEAAILVVPSRSEGLPSVIMEAMARGRPVVAAAVDGIPELVTEETGWLVPPDDPGALADALLKALRRPAESLTACGLRGRQRVLLRHDARRQAAELEYLFQLPPGPN